MYRVLSVVTVVLLKSATYNFGELSGVLFVQMVYYLEFSRKKEVRGAATRQVAERPRAGQNLHLLNL
jgi:hypothetical protein